MYPTLFELPSGIGIHTYGLFIVLAFSAAFLYVHVRAQQVGFHPDKLISVYLSAAVGGLLGGRLLYAVAVEPARTLADPLSLFSFSGFAFYGGVLGGAIGVAVLAWVQKINMWKLADLAGPSVIIGHGVGRFGCLFAGCCHGAEAPVGEHPVGLLPASFPGGQFWLDPHFPFLTTEFHTGVGRLLDVPLYPTQLWTIVGNLGLAVLLAWIWKRRRFDGQIAALALMLEPPVRVFVESFRADHRGYVFTWPVSDRFAEAFPGLVQAGSELQGNVMGLTTSQTIGLCMIAVGAVLYVLRRHAGVEAETPVVADDEVLLEDLAP